jgi:hypothetical protein
MDGFLRLAPDQATESAEAVNAGFSRRFFTIRSL